MRILVIGAGAIGSVVGGLLAEGGHEVTLLGRLWHMSVVRQHGLVISGIWGEHRILRIATAASPGEVPMEPAFDWVFVCVKAHQTTEALETISQYVGPDTLLCAFQNGLGNYEALTRAIPPDRVALGRVIFGVELEPGHARVTVWADDLLIGAPDERVPRDRIAALAEALSASGIPAKPTADIMAAVWAKALYNCALNGLSTVLEVPYGGLLNREPARRLMRAIIREAYRVAAAQRVTLEPTTPEAYVERLFSHLIPVTAVHRSSMLQDIRRGRPTEIEALNGALVRLGQQAGMAMPANALVTRLVHAKERFARSLGEV